MRKLTIKRAKRFVACLAAMKVYIEDSTAKDITIDGVTCRKLGTLKNGEEKTFEISNEAAKVFVIADKLSKGYCNEYYSLPGGEEDIALTGKNEFNPATGNAFRFDGVTDEDVLANRRKGTSKGIIVLALALVIGFIVGFAISAGTIIASLFGSSSKEQAFSSGGMTITLTAGFEEAEYEGYAACYNSKKVAVFAIREDFDTADGLEDYTVLEYGRLVLETNDINSPLKSVEDLTFFEYTESGYTYCAFVFKSEDAFWLVQFATSEKDIENYQTKIFKWAQTITFE